MSSCSYPPSPAPSPSPLTCQPSVSGVFPNSIQGSGRGVSDVITEGPPERGSQGPRHHGGLGVPHPREGLQGCCPGAATILLGSRSSSRRRPPGAAGGGSARRPGPGPGPGTGTGGREPRACRSRQCGSRCGPECADCRRPPGAQPGPARLPHLERLSRAATPAQLWGCLRGSPMMLASCVIE